MGRLTLLDWFVGFEACGWLKLSTHPGLVCSEANLSFVFRYLSVHCETFVTPHVFDLLIALCSRNSCV